MHVYIYIYVYEKNVYKINVCMYVCMHVCMYNPHLQQTANFLDLFSNLQTYPIGSTSAPASGVTVTASPGSTIKHGSRVPSPHRFTMLVT